MLDMVRTSPTKYELHCRHHTTTFATITDDADDLQLAFHDTESAAEIPYPCDTLATAYVLAHIVYSVTGEHFTALRDVVADMMADDLNGLPGALAMVRSTTETAPRARIAQQALWFHLV